jgi:hypothetical protein
VSAYGNIRKEAAEKLAKALANKEAPPGVHPHIGLFAVVACYM